MEGSVIENIAALVRKPMMVGDLLLRPDDWCVEDPESLIKPGPTAKTLIVSTLGSVRDYLTANKDGLPLDSIQVHIVGPTSVQVLGPLDVRARVRETFVAAIATDLTDGFIGRFMSLEDFLVGLQIRFADADDRRRMLALLSNVKHETVKTALDDGEKLPPAKWRIVEELIGAYPKALAKDTLAERIGVSPTSGGYFNNLGSLRSLGLLDYPRPSEVVASPVLFLNGQ
jgi:hypothetical protein